MKFADLFAGQAPREVSGSLSANRFAYQVSWALCHLLELHSGDGDYAIVMDFHEDIVVLNCSSAPTEARFYQVKTGSANWTPKRLVSRRNGKSGLLPSILGKLYNNYIFCKDATRHLGFVSNVPLSANDANENNTKSETTVRFAQIHADDAKILSDAIVAEFPNEDETSGLDLFVFDRSPIPSTGHADVAIGRVTQFLDNDPTTAHVRPNAFYRALKSQLDHACHCEQVPADFAELRKLKAITREDFVGMIAHACAQVAPDSLADRIASQLQSEKEDFRLVERVRTATIRLRVKLLDSTNAMLNDDMEEIRTNLLPHGPEHATLRDTIDAVLESQGCQEIRSRWPEDDVRAMIGVCIYESEAELPHADPDAQDEEA